MISSERASSARGAMSDASLMSDVKPKVEGASIVLVGSFNPSIVTPAWLAGQGLLRPEEGTEKDTIVTPEFSSFSLDWLQVQVQSDRFTVHCTDPAEYATLQELVLGIFHYLEFTPVSQVGLNRRMHFEVSSESVWHGLGDMLAPKGPWVDVMRGSHREGDLPGLSSLRMEGQRDNSDAKYVRVTVEPSLRVVPGLYIAANEHYETEGGEEPAGTLLQYVRDDWRLSLDYASRVASHLIEMVEGGK